MNVRHKTTQFRRGLLSMAACILMFLLFLGSFRSIVMMVSEISIFQSSCPTYDCNVPVSSLRNTNDISSAALNTTPAIDTFSINRSAPSRDPDLTDPASAPGALTDNTTNTALAAPAATTSNTSSTNPLIGTNTTKHVGINTDSSLHGRVLVATWVFGEEANNKKYFQLFVESARTSGIDIVIIGDHVPKFKLPNNVQHIHIQWKELIDRLFDHGVVPSLPSHVSKHSLPIYNIDNYYKVNDYRPLFGYLFPEVLKGYEWWGHCDNDMLLGNVAKFLLRPKDRLDNYDVIVGMEDVIHRRDGVNEELGLKANAHGPFQLYRNQKLTNELFKMMTEAQRLEVFLATENQVFDENGGMEYKGIEAYKFSMGGLIHYHGTELGIRVNRDIGDWYWDGGWWGYTAADNFTEQRPASCPPCIYSHKHGISSPRSKFNYREELYSCHFQKSKHIIEEGLRNQEGLVERLIERGEWQVDCANGYSFDSLL